jgi:hypothetical protein
MDVYTKIRVISDTSHIQNNYESGLSKSDTSTTRAKSFSRNILSIAPQDLHRRMLYLQPKHLHLHDRGVSHVRIGESMSSPTQEYNVVQISTYINR